MIKWKTRWRSENTGPVRVWKPLFVFYGQISVRSSNISAWKYQKQDRSWLCSEPWKWHATLWHCRLAGGALVTGRLPQCWCKLWSRCRHDDTVCVFSSSTLTLRMKLGSAAPSMTTSVPVINPLHDSIKILERLRKCTFSLEADVCDVPAVLERYYITVETSTSFRRENHLWKALADHLRASFKVVICWKTFRHVHIFCCAHKLELLLPGD